MTTPDFTSSILVEQHSKKAFNAINNIREWWSEEIEGCTEKLNDEFTLHKDDVHRCKMRIIEVIPGKKVVWLVLDNYFSFTKEGSEWIGTKICFEIIERDNKTQILFTHFGLVPEYEFYGVCSNAWKFLINDSLYNLINSGKGKPNPKKL